MESHELRGSGRECSPTSFRYGSILIARSASVGNSIICGVDRYAESNGAAAAKARAGLYLGECRGHIVGRNINAPPGAVATRVRH